MSATIHTLGELRQQHGSQPRSVKEEIRDNLIRKLQAGEPLFPASSATTTPSSRSW